MAQIGGGIRGAQRLATEGSRPWRLLMSRKTKRYILLASVVVLVVIAIATLARRGDAVSRGPVSRVSAISESSVSLYRKTVRLDDLFRSTDIEVLARETDSRIASGDICIDVAWAYLACRVHKAGARDYSVWKRNVLDSCSDNNLRGFVSTMID